jgi:hypothetical protein
MATHNLTDIVSTINISKSEYEELVRESNTLRIIENLVSTKKYVDAETLRSILSINLEESEGEK